MSSEISLGITFRATTVTRLNLLVYITQWNKPLHQMSDLHRSAISARLAKLPQLPTLAPQDVDNEETEEEDSLGSLPNMGPPGAYVTYMDL